MIFGRETSPGCKLTLKFCKEYLKPYYIFPWTFHSKYPLDIKDFKQWLKQKEIEILNVAGNREEKNPGIFEAVKLFLITSIKE